MDLRKLLKDLSVYFECVEFGNLIFENYAFIAKRKTRNMYEKTKREHDVLIIESIINGYKSSVVVVVIFCCYNLGFVECFQLNTYVNLKAVHDERLFQFPMLISVVMFQVLIFQRSSLSVSIHVSTLRVC